MKHVAIVFCSFIHLFACVKCRRTQISQSLWNGKDQRLDRNSYAAAAAALALLRLIFYYLSLNVHFFVAFLSVRDREIHMYMCVFSLWWRIYEYVK